MSKPSNETIVSMIESAKKLLAQKHPRPATAEELTAVHKKLNAAVDSLKSDQVRHQLYLLKGYRRALHLRLQAIQRPLKQLTKP